MRKFIKQAGCSMMIMIFALLATPLAQADEASFLAGARALGFEEDDNLLIRMALSACRFLQPHLNRHPVEVEEHISRYASLEPASVPDPSRPPEPAPDPHRFLVLSVTEYCPELAYRVLP